MATRKLFEDFEAATLSGSGNWYYLSTWAAYLHGIGTSPDYVPFIEGLDKVTSGFTPYSGTRCLGLESVTPPPVGNTVDRTCDIILGWFDLTTTNELYVSLRRFISTDFHIDAGDYSRLIPLFQDGGPNWYPTLSATMANISSMGVNYTDALGVSTFINSSGFSLPLGRWFRQEFYIRRDSVNGAVIIWIDGVQVVNATGLSLIGAGTAPYFGIFGERHSPTDTFVPYRQWIDDVEIFDGLPTVATGVVQGTIYNANTNAPVAGATITLSQYSATTNASGFYQIPSVPIGTYSMTVNLAGYQSNTVSVTVLGEQTITQNVFLTPQAQTTEIPFWLIAIPVAAVGVAALGYYAFKGDKKHR